VHFAARAVPSPGAGGRAVALPPPARSDAADTAVALKFYTNAAAFQAVQVRNRLLEASGWRLFGLVRGCARSLDCRAPARSLCTLATMALCAAA
jgi:hypothetical protein